MTITKRKFLKSGIAALATLPLSHTSIASNSAATKKVEANVLKNLTDKVMSPLTLCMAKHKP